MTAKKEKSMDSMKAAIIAQLVMIVKTKPAHSKPSIISTKAMGELIDKVEERVPGWVKRTAHLEKVRTFQSALQQAKNHDIDVSCLTVEEGEKRIMIQIKKRRTKRRRRMIGRSLQLSPTKSRQNRSCTYMSIITVKGSV